MRIISEKMQKIIDFLDLDLDLYENNCSSTVKSPVGLFISTGYDLA